MSDFPCLVRFVSGSGQVRYRLGERLADRYLEFVAGRCRPNTLREVAFDLKAFFTVVAKVRVPRTLPRILSPGEADRLAAVGSRLPSPQWPARRLLLVAVDAETGETRVFDRDSGADLVDAVAASCAVPGIWPPVTIGGHRYVDGGIRSSDNADLAAGCAGIVVLSPLGYDSPFPSPMALRDVVGRLRSEGSAVTVITPDEASVAAMGINPLDPATRRPAAQAGLAQGRAGLPADGAA